MTHNRFNKITHSRLTIAAGLSLIIIMALSVAAFAFLYTIDTTDSTVAEWDNQGIPTFQTDPTGDTINGGGNQDDIVETRVATGNDGKLYFRLQTLASPAVNALNHSAAAYIDCDRDGVTGEQDDRLVTYIPHYSPFGIGSGSERITLCEGNEGQCTALGPDAGQQVNEYIEWGVTIADLPANCQDDVDIKFYTAIAVFGAQSTVLDETTPLKGWNIPTAVNLKGVQARGSSIAGVAALIALGLFLIAGAAIWRRRTA